jgi:hypothetical protein
METFGPKGEDLDEKENVKDVPLSKNSKKMATSGHHNMFFLSLRRNNYMIITKEHNKW